MDKRVKDTIYQPLVSEMRTRSLAGAIDIFLPLWYLPDFQKNLCKLEICRTAAGIPGNGYDMKK